MTTPGSDSTPDVPPQALDRSRRPSPGALKSFRLPEITQRRLENGLRLWIVSRPDFRIAYSSIVLQCGAVADPAGLSGLAAMTADLFDTGTSRIDALTVSRELERLGSSLKVRAGYDGTSVGMDFLSRNGAASFNILGELLAEAAYRPEELERLRNQRLTALLQQKERPAAVASLALYRLLYGKDHPYGNDPDGTERSVRSLSRDDILRFYRTHYHPSDATMIVVGGVDERGFESLIEGVTGRWDGQSPRENPEITPDAYRPRILVVDRPNAPQTEIRVGCPGIRRTSPDFFPSVLLNRILGGQFSSRLNANLREKRGFTYGAWSSFSYGKYPGPFAAGSAVQSEVTGEAVREILREIDSIRLSGITEDELAFTRAGIEGGFALMFESPGQVIAILQNLVLYDLPEDHYATYLDNIRRVTREDVLNTAARLLKPSELSVVTVGDAGTILPQLEGIGLREIEMATVDQLEL